MRKLAVGVVCALTGCAGGGGGGGDGSWLMVEPNAMTMMVYEGDPVEFGITATQVKGVDPGDGILYVGIVQAGDVVEPGYQVLPNVQGVDWYADLHLRRTLPVGVYRGTFELRLCHDADIAVCAHPWPGSPWVIPYSFTVQQGIDLKPLTALPNAGPWSTFQGNAAHTGFVPAPALSKANFDRRWGFVVGAVTSVAIDSGVVFVVSRVDSDPLWGSFTLYAIQESDGQVKWSKALGNGYDASPPAAGNGQVYVALNAGMGSALLVFDQETGDAAPQDPLGTQFAHWGAPEVYGVTVYTQAGSVGGMVSYDTATPKENWFISYSGMDSDPWTAAVDGTYVYGREDGNLVVLSVSDGSTVTSIADDEPSGRFFWFDTGGPVLGATGLAYASYIDGANGDAVAGGRLVAYDTTATPPVRKWSVGSKFRSAPVLANGVLYIVDGDALSARSPITGAQQWSWSPPGGLMSFTNTARHLAVVGDKAIVDGGEDTFIVDLATHATAYVYPAGGAIAVSDNGVAYISGRNGALVAINLQ